MALLPSPPFPHSSLPPCSSSLPSFSLPLPLPSPSSLALLYPPLPPSPSPFPPPLLSSLFPPPSLFSLSPHPEKEKVSIDIESGGTCSTDLSASDPLPTPKASDPIPTPCSQPLDKPSMALSLPSSPAVYMEVQVTTSIDHTLLCVFFAFVAGVI